MSKKEVVIVDAIRTPFDKFGGAMKDISSIQLGAFVIAEIAKRNNLMPDGVDEIFYGTCIPAETALNLNVPARQAVLHSGLNPATRSLTIDRACCSSMSAIQMAVRSIRAEEADVVLAVGAENMSHTPHITTGARWGTRLGHVTLEDPLFELGYKGWEAVAVDAGEVALEEGVTREEQDRWAARSQQRYQEALAAGRYADEVVPYTIKGKKEDIVMTEDASPRPGTSYEKLASLPTIYGSATCTAGNAPGMNAGASAILLMSREKAEAMGAKVLGTVVDAVSVGGPARDLARIPAAAIKDIMQRNSITMDDISLVEINEAFAAVTLTSTRILSEGDDAKWEASLLAKSG